jgi:hypothetical protein
MLSDKIKKKKKLMSTWDSMPNLVTQVGRFEIETTL